MKALDLAEHILWFCTKIGKPISNLQLQKMLYFVNMHYLINYKEFLIEDDFEAWTYGPVIKNVYYKYSGYIADEIILFDEPKDKLPKEYKIAFENFILKLRELSSWKLVEMSHQQGFAWSKTYKNGSGNRHIINRNYIKEDAKRYGHG